MNYIKVFKGIFHVPPVEYSAIIGGKFRDLSVASRLIICLGK